MAAPTCEGFHETVGHILAPGTPFATTSDGDGRTIMAALPGTVGDFLRFACAQHGDKPALVMGGERFTYADLHALSERVAQALVARGISKGDRVGIAMRNCPVWVIAYMGIVKAGGIATLLNGWWTGAEMAHALAITAPLLVIADGPRCAAIGDAAPCLAIDVDAPAETALAPLLAAGAGDLPAIAPDDDATILFTSGSTGRSRGAVCTHRAVTTGVYTYFTLTLGLLHHFHGGDPSRLPYPPSVLVAVPLFHVTGEIVVMLNSLALGRKLVLMRKWDAAEALRLIEAERITYFVGVPTMSIEIADHPDAATRDTTSLMDIASGGAARPPAHLARIRSAFPAGNPMQGYGLTETNAVGCTNFRDAYMDRPDSSGRAHWPFGEMAVFRDGLALPPGEVGEIGIRSAANMRGYWNDPAATAACFTDDGYFLTGDLGRIDAEGFVYIVDRLKDIIIRGGENIACLEVEAELAAAPGVREASVFGLPDARLGEVPVAVVHGDGLDEAALRAFLEPRLARFKLPERIWLAEEPLPKLGTGKVDKGALRRVYGGR
jgi:long-chain acyl-CoA synthetase